MNEIILVKYGEIALKGLNKSTFESILVRNIKRRLRPVGQFENFRRQSTVYITPKEEVDMDEAVKRLGYIFGIGAIQRCLVLPKDFDEIVKIGVPYLEDALDNARTLKVEAKSADKTFAFKMPDSHREQGGAIV